MIDIKTKTGYAALYVQGLIQGIGFTTIPSASNFLTSPDGFHFSASQYGWLFLPMILGAIASSFFGGILGKRLGIKNVFVAGSVCNITSMGLIALSQVFRSTPSSSYLLLMIAMLLLGAGFGANLTTLNTYTFYYFPKKGEQALTALHSCLGIGTAIGPLSFSVFLTLNRWWIDPLGICAIYAVLLWIALWAFPSRVELAAGSRRGAGCVQHRWIFTFFIFIAFLYGICETTFGNWGTIFLHREKNLSEVDANWALSLFWATVTIGRITVFLLSFTLSPRIIYRILSSVILISLYFIYHIDTSLSGALSFALAGLGCSAFLPLTISFGEKRFLASAQLVSGVLMALYMSGYGVASVGVGLLRQYIALSFESVYAWLSLPVIFLGLLCCLVTRKQKKAI